MHELTNKDLQLIKGGFGVGALIGIFGGITFIIGLIDGFVRPLKCHK